MRASSPKQTDRKKADKKRSLSSSGKELNEMHILDVSPACTKTSKKLNLFLSML